MKKLTIQSTPAQPGNVGNMAHQITVNRQATHRAPQPVHLILSNYWSDNKAYDFNISREAAIELMLALDVILDVEEEAE